MINHPMIFKGLGFMLIAIPIMFLLLIGNPTIANAQTDPNQLTKAVQEIEALDGMRTQLASTLKNQPEAPDLDTFKQVCKPVGIRAKQLSQENGWKVRQIANKYRNPVHSPNSLQETMALANFEQNPELMGFWQREMMKGEKGTAYYRRINVEGSCLACHGAKNSRPKFVQEKYPQDLAYDFKEGDLRGMYGVFIPDIQAALTEFTP
ncbi:hypothetical protein CY0110_12112 [Crocosphaera chwakensis CCY0110]|uniref:Tll0287-like domain-containing protein n=2 Tax=Crocosphaera TaxID=263510 RepID=A3IWM9_9CHRO|nr:hypothetical protein CY0110_12112 [Crocosphaera chwakensis CCY0110]